jgi:hypothetical protein
MLFGFGRPLQCFGNYLELMIVAMQAESSIPCLFSVPFAPTQKNVAATPTNHVETTGFWACARTFHRYLNILIILTVHKLIIR